MTRSPVVDVHTHMLTNEWVSLLESHGGPSYTLKSVSGGLRAIHLDGAPFMTPVPNMFDWEARIANMNKARVDIAITSLTCPNVYWGSAEVSLKAARVANDDMAKAQKTWPERIRWFASLPWQHEKLALEELKRACDNGAVGVMVLANIAGKALTDSQFSSIWKEIDRRALPVLVHPTAPPGVAQMGMHEFQLTAPIGFTFDTSLAVARCIYDGFFDRYPNLKLIASHGGGALEELKRACDNGAVGVMVLANIAGKALTDSQFSSIWKEIDRRALPALVHPTAPPGVAQMGMREFQLTAPIGFTFDTSLAVARCIYDGFFDRYPNLKLIASHGGGALPYLVGRLDICWDNIPAARAKTAEPPRNYMRRIYVDSVVFRQDVLNMCVSVCGPDNVLYGSDYPHTIGDMAGCLSRVDALPGDVRHQVRGWNAQRIFKL